MAEELDPALENYRNAWHALRMIREAVERLSPPGTLASEEAVLKLYGPEPIHEGQAIIEALTKVLDEPDKEARRLRRENERLLRALRNFTFPAYPDGFKDAADDGMTECIVNDEYVQEARRLTGFVPVS